MPLDSKHLLEFLDNITDEKYRLELLNLLLKRINKLCFEECQIDRIQCTLMPLCSRRFLLKLRILNGLSIDDLPKFCYSVHKGVILRDYRDKTVVYKPFDTYLYLIDFLDIFFHGDYRKLNKFISFGKWDEVLEIFEERKLKYKNFYYLFSDNYIIFKFEERVHIVFINEKYVLCNARREKITGLGLLYALCKLYCKIYFPEFNVEINASKYVIITSVIPPDVLLKISKKPTFNEDLKLNKYFWDTLPKDLDAMAEICKKIRLQMNVHKFLEIKLYINLETNNYLENIEKKIRIPLKFNDLKLLFNFLFRLYNDFYIYWIE
ncbi:MAG: hypothetical protein ACFFAN_03140 [Promethearchaeota archaeon]